MQPIAEPTTDRTALGTPSQRALMEKGGKLLRQNKKVRCAQGRQRKDTSAFYIRV